MPTRIIARDYWDQWGKREQTAMCEVGTLPALPSLLSTARWGPKIKQKEKTHEIDVTKSGNPNGAITLGKRV